MDIEASNNFLTEKSISNAGLLELIGRSEKIVLLSHINPDGDAIGSQYALMDYCLKSGCLVRAFVPSKFPSNLTFINPNGLIVEFDEELHKAAIIDADLIIILDLNDSHRVGKIEPYLLSSPAKKVLIDHHLEPKDFCDSYIVDFKAASTGQLVFSVIREDIKYNLSRESAQALYTAIMTDTGSFRFPKTDSYIHRIIAELIDAGASPASAYNQVYNSFPLSALKLRGITYNNIKLLNNDKVCITSVSRDDFKNCGASEEETEGIVESLLSIRGVTLAAFLIESPDRDEIRCSFRARENSEVRTIAVHFGGGGHAQAAGARIYKTALQDAERLILEFIDNNQLLLS